MSFLFETNYALELALLTNAILIRRYQQDSESSKMVSLFVVGKCDDLDDLIRFAPKKKQQKVEPKQKVHPTQEQIMQDFPFVFDDSPPKTIRELPPIV